MKSVKHRKEKPVTMPVQGDKLPADMKTHKRWVLWRWIWRDTKWDKPPFTLDGTLASSTDPEKWATYEEASAALAGGSFDGLGYVMGAGSGKIGVDFDYCRDPDTGVVSEPAATLIRDLGTYAEVSPSGTGVKLWFNGDMPPGEWRNKNDDIGLEVYTNKRYFTVTGHIINDLPVAEAGPQLTRLMVNYLSRTTEVVKKDRPKDVAFTIEAAKSALEAVSPNCDYKKWIDIGMSLSWLSDSLFDTWDSWSAKGDDYPGTDNLHSHWTSFSGANSKVTIGTLFYYAKQNGWVAPDNGYEGSDYGVARRVCDKLEGTMFYIPEWKKWVCWNGKAFVTDSSGALAEVTVRVSKDMTHEVSEGDPEKKEDVSKHKAWGAFCMHYQSARGIDSVERLARGMCSLDYRDLDPNPKMFHCANGVLNLNTCLFEPHNAAHLNTRVSSVTYDPTAKCPRFEKFVFEVTGGDRDLANYMQRIVGFCLSGSVENQSIFVMHGGGNNGKGVFTRTLLKLLGDYAGPISQDLLMSSPHQHPTQFAYLYGKRCVVAQETDQDCELNEAQVKNLTGGDDIQCRRMREDFWSFSPTHKILLATNHKPNIKGTDNGIWRRLKPIPFNVTFTAEQIDLTLETKLDAELSGILNWAIEGWCDFLLVGLDEPEAVKEAHQEYRADMNIVAQFVDEKCVRGPNLTVSNDQFYAAFKMFCDDQGFARHSSRKICADLDRIGIKSGKINRFTRAKIGVALRSEFAETEAPAAF